ncbi:zinc finger protein 280C [Dasypus novemcinctus]|uniref:zinc finger protein 280C n=1 Tax=Dasypus novemcinctus TaxID=9361 RepID=UPI00265D6A88|nr:zinc finger protein 280C [Dasypus novemcinctus]XP_058148239.1 zinc finger protein 280C [Dasypus novemcinctus]
MDDDDDLCQPKSNSKMAELFMECEEEELEPWQKKVEEIEDEDDDELIFVGEISSSKPAISNILNRGNSSSSSKGVKNEILSQGVPDASKPVSQQNTNPAPDPVASSPRSHQESKSSSSAIIVQSPPKADFANNSSQVESDDSSDVLFDLTQETPLSESQEGTTVTIEGVDQSSPPLKRPSTSEANSVSPKKPKTSTKSSVPSSQDVLTKGTNTSSAQCKTGATFLRACPKCNVTFNLLDPLKYHMKHCCPDMINNFLEMIKTELSNTEDKNKTNTGKGKLIMLVSDFYYGRHEGNVEEEQKTYTTFKCFSCLKVLKNNIRFMNHMKHHLELEKQNSESWENHTTCQHCYRQYPTPFQLQCHIESTHTPHEFSTICKICELSFESEHILLQHMKDTHKPGEMPYVCQVCQYRSSIFSDVETHFRASHENTKNLLCPFCLKVSKMATPYMNHYMKHQKKGVHRCSKCRLQFLTCKEKTDHKIQHRTFIKPKALEGLPPGTKVTIRASIGSLQSKSSTSPSSSTPSTSSTLQVSPPKSKNITAKNSTKSNASKSKTSKPHTTAFTAGKPHASKPHATTSTAGKPHANKPHSTTSTAGKPHANKPHTIKPPAGKPNTSKPHATASTASKPGISKPQAATSTTSKPNTNKSNTGRSKCKSKAYCKQKKQRNRKDQISTALKNLRCCRGIHKCIECRSKIKDFASHFSTFVHCSFCKYNTNCSKAFVNHMMSSHSNHPSKRFCIFKKHSGTLGGITLVCLKCDFLADCSGLDQMAKHLSQRKTHTCQVITENVSDSTSSEPTSDCLLK